MGLFRENAKISEQSRISVPLSEASLKIS